MSYKNSVRLLTSNFVIVWKQLLYMLVVCLLTAGIFYGAAYQSIEVLKAEGVIKELGNIFETMYTAPVDIVKAIVAAFSHMSAVLSANFSTLWLSLVSTALVGVLYYLLKNISMYNISSVMYMKMTSFASIGYTRNLISTLWQAVRYSFAKFVYSLPIFALKALTIYTYFNLVSSTLSMYIGIFIVMVIILLLSAIELALFTGMAGKMLDNNGNMSAFKAFFAGNVVVFKDLPRVYSNAIIVAITLVFVNAFLGLFTLGAALIITLPASMVFVSIFELTAFIGAKRERYYLTESLLANPSPKKK